jgi:hypothetical protein
MNDLGTILYVNHFAAIVEDSKAKGDTLAHSCWPSDAPAVPRTLNNLKQRNVELYREKAYLRRLALFKSAARRGASL